MHKKKIQDLKQEFSKRTIEEIRKISAEGGQGYSPEAILAAKELLLERDPSFDKIDLILHLQHKNERSIADIEHKVGCLYSFIIVQIGIIIITFVIALLQGGKI